MPETARSFVPAAGHDWLLPLYDPLQRLMRTASIHEQIIDRANLRDDHRVLDIGCGTGSLAIALARTRPEVEVVAIDPDPKALRRARRKSERAGVVIRFDTGFADRLPYDSGSFHRVLSSFMFHHLPAETKRLTLLEARRVLRPGGRLHLVDFGGSSARKDGWLARRLHALEHLHDNLDDRISVAMTHSGFEDVREIDHRRTVFGSVIHLRGRSPDHEVG
jgi:ubiquinone/menaquinone biosynthesis C-methylase UbiE